MYEIYRLLHLYVRNTLYIYTMVRFMDCYVATLTSGVRTFTVAPEAGTMMLTCEILRLSRGHVMMMIMMTC